MSKYRVTYRRGTSSPSSITVTASSASQAKEQVKERFHGDVTIISAVEL